MYLFHYNGSSQKFETPTWDNVGSAVAQSVER